MNIIFLDIDGVLQPYNSNGRFEIDDDGLVKELTKRYGVDYAKYHSCDVAAAYCDWDKEAVNRIKTIIEETNAKVVISSDWRDKEKRDKLKDFFRIYGLEDYIIDQTAEYRDIKTEVSYDENYDHRTIEILEYVKNHKNIANFIAIDDKNLSYGLEGHFVHTYNLINEKQVNESINLLLKQDISSKGKKLPYNITDYKELITNGYYYADRTENIYNIMHKDSHDGWATLNLLPKGAGKSLFASTLYYYFDINSKSMFKKLFKGTDIYEKKYICNNTCHVLKFDFGNIIGETASEIIKSIELEVKNAINYFCNYYNISYTIKEEDFASILDSFLNYLKSLEFGYEIFVIIDNYNEIAIKLFFNKQKEIMDEIFGVGSYFSKFYATLKLNQGFVKHLYITGVSNIAMNVIMYNCDVEVMNCRGRKQDIFGFTYEEVEELLNIYDLDDDKKKNIYNDIINNYRGYKEYSYHDKESEFLINFNDVIFYLKRYFDNEDMNFNYIERYNEIIKLANINDDYVYKQILMKCLTGSMHEEYELFKKSFEIEQQYLEKQIGMLLYYFGCLTYNDFGRLEVANNILRDYCEKCYLELFELENISSIINKVKNTDIKSFINYFDNRFDNLDLSLLMYLVLKKYGIKNIDYKYGVYRGYCTIIKINNSLIGFMYLCESEKDEEEKEELIEKIKKRIDIEDNVNLKKYVVIFMKNRLEVFEEIK